MHQAGKKKSEILTGNKYRTSQEIRNIRRAGHKKEIFARQVKTIRNGQVDMASFTVQLIQDVNIKILKIINPFCVPRYLKSVQF